MQWTRYNNNMSNKYEIVYLVQHKNIPQYTKIGYTTRNDLSKRIKELNTASPTGIIEVATFNVPVGRGFQVEQALHAKYAGYQSNLEWYQLSTSQIDEIKNWIEHITNK